MSAKAGCEPLSKEPLKVMTASVLCKLSDLRPDDLLLVTIDQNGTDHQMLRLFHSYSSESLTGETLGLLRRDGHCEWVPLGIVKSIRLLARDAKLAFSWASSLEERYEHLKELIQSVASRTDDFARDVKNLCGHGY